MDTNYDQIQFCLSGRIEPNGTPLAPCVYESNNLDQFNILPMGQSNIEGNSYIRIPPNMKVYLYDRGAFNAPLSDATTIEGTGLGVQPISNVNAYTVRTMSQCTYMSNCYHHRNGMTPELCQGYWNTEIPCEDSQPLFFPTGTNPAVFYFIGIAILMILFIVIICLMIIVAKKEFRAQVEADSQCNLSKISDDIDSIYWGV